MMQIARVEYSSVAEMMASYAESGHRVRSLPPRSQALPAPEPIVIELLTPKPMWMVADISFSAHIDAWRKHISSPVNAYIRRRATEMGRSMHAIMRPTRGKKAEIRDRSLLIWEVRQKFNLSLPQIGRIFGRDHTSILAAIRRVEAERGE